MARFFRKAIDRQFSGSLSVLDAERSQFGSGRLSGLIEVQALPQETEVLVYAGGVETGVYRVWPNSQLKIAAAELGAGWTTQAVPMRSLALPDQASRAVWQALESRLQTHKDLNNLEEWKGFLHTCRLEGQTALVEVASEACDGFVFLYEGLPAASEAIFCSMDGFTASLPAAEGYLNCPSQLSIYSTDVTADAYQCALLRMSAVKWGNRILASYQDTVGQKLLRILNANLNALLIRQQWNIRPVNAEIIDNHFFHDCKTAGQAYRTLFEDMTQLIARVIGKLVTRRLIGIAYDQLGYSLQQTLHVQTLTPAEFLR